MEKPEYMRMPLKLMPEEIVKKYNLKELENDGWIYIKIVRGMYGLPQAGKIANELLKSVWEKVGITLLTSHQEYGPIFGDQ